MSKKDRKIIEIWLPRPWKIKHFPCTVVNFQGFRILRKWLKNDCKNRPKSTPEPPQIDEKTMLKWVLKIRWKSVWFFIENRAPKGPQNRGKSKPKGGKKEHKFGMVLNIASRPQNRGPGPPQIEENQCPKVPKSMPKSMENHWKRYLPVDPEQ